MTFCMNSPQHLFHYTSILSFSRWFLVSFVLHIVNNVLVMCCLWIYTFFMSSISSMMDLYYTYIIIGSSRQKSNETRERKRVGLINFAAIMMPLATHIVTPFFWVIDQVNYWRFHHDYDMRQIFPSLLSSAAHSRWLDRSQFVMRMIYELAWTEITRRESKGDQ